jgi:hypothetical protein
VSFDSVNLDPTSSLAAMLTAKFAGMPSARDFICEMKADHPFAVEYYARLVRFSIRWAGPLISVNGKPPAVLAWLSRAAMAEFQALLS